MQVRPIPLDTEDQADLEVKRRFRDDEWPLKNFRGYTEEAEGEP